MRNHQSLEMQNIHAELQYAIKAREYALSNINEATDPDLIDAAIHEYEAADKRLNYLIRQVKKLRLPRELES